MVTTIPCALGLDTISQAEADLANGWSLPYAWLGDPAMHAFEQGAIFERSWQVAGLERDVQEPGSHITVRIGHMPVMVVRGRDGELRAFLNICRHRGYPVAEGAGCRQLLVCRYHGWSYDLTGRLMAVPGADAALQSQRDSLGLRPGAVSCWQGIVFVNVDAGAIPLRDTYPALDGLAARAGLDLPSYSHQSRVDVDMACDWKLLYDNAAECYHCTTIHGSSLNRMYASNGFFAGGWQDGVRYARATLTDGKRLHHSVQLFPGMLLFADPVIGLLGRIHPTEPGRSRFSVDYFSAPGADPGEAGDFIGLWTQTLREDSDLLALQAIGAASGGIARGRLLMTREDSLPGVQAMILGAYRDAIIRQGQ